MSLRLVTESQTVETFNQYPKSIVDTLARLQELTGLSDNWDSYGALSPTKDAILGAIELAMNLFSENTPSPDVFPSPTGSVQFEWSCSGLDIEIEIQSNRRCIASFDDVNVEDRYWERDFTFDLTDLKSAIEELTSRNSQTRLHLVDG